MNVKQLMAVMMVIALLMAGCSAPADNAATTTAEQTTAAPTTVATTAAETEPQSPIDALGDVEITFWHAMNSRQEEALTALTEQFMQANPNIKVTLQNQSSYGDLSQKLVATMQSPKNLPTITQAYPDWVLPMINEGMVVDLGQFINHGDQMVAFDNWDDVLTGLRDGVTVDGKVYGMPFNKSTEVIWYNKTLFDELGLTPPTTYQELADVSKKIYDAKGIPGAGFDSLANFYTTYLINQGVKFDASLDVTGDASKAAANYYFDGIKGGYFRIAGTDKYLSGPLANEQVAMYIGSNAGETYVRDGVAGKFDYAAAPYPSQSAIQQGTDIYMFDSASADQQLAAYLYLKHLTTAGAQIEWALATGYMPIRQSAIQDDAYAKSDSAIAPILDQATANLYTRPLVSGSQQAYNDSRAMLEALLASPDGDVDEALKSFKATYDSAWQ